MRIIVNSLLDNISKRANLQFSVFIVSLSIVFSLAIYLREVSIKDQVDFIKVLLWQMIIWTPWAIVFYLSPKVRAGLRTIRYGDALYYGSGLVWVCIHYGWFFLISSNYSPYLGKPATGYGVYPYFFIFWSLIDLIIIGLIIYIQIPDNSVKKVPKPKLIELTRGGETFFCNPYDIHWLSSDNYYTHLYTIRGKFIMRKTLKYYHEHINSYEFIQIHRSTIVNLRYIKGLTKYHNKLCVILKDGTKKTVSKKNIPNIRLILKNQML